MLALAFAALLESTPAATVARLEASLALFQHARTSIERKIGNSQAIDLAYRLIQDEQNLAMPVPVSYAADWRETLETESDLDTQAMRDLAAGTPHPLSLSRSGLYETFLRSSVDGTWLPTAVYVPAGAKPGAPLALMLHGNTQSETNLLGQPFFRRLADRTGTILVAPWGRGAFDFEGAARTEVYDVLSAVQRAFAPDRKHTYLVGYSMGGYSVFELGPHYNQWSAVMDVCGAIPQEAGPPVLFAWRDTPVYVVTGTRDAVIPPAYPEQTATTLAGVGIPTSFYEEPSGEHMLRTLVPALSSAWTDMHAGVVRSGSVPAVRSITLPKLARNGADGMKP